MTDAPSRSAGDLADAILILDDERGAAPAEEVVFADDLLPGVGDEELPLREGLRQGGWFVFVVLLLIAAFDELESAALSVLAPDIQATFGISTGAIVFISATAGAFLVLGSLPMGYLADRVRRGPVIGGASVLFAAMVCCSGLAVNAFGLFLARVGVGVSKSANLPVHTSLLADTYPIATRGRVGASIAAAGRVVGTISPLLVGGIAIWAGGVAGWRWAFIILGVPVLVVGIVAFRLPEPPRGQYEKLDVVGSALEESDPAPISVEAAFSRIMQIRTIRSAIVAFAAMGFGIFTLPVLGNLVLEQEYGLDAGQRGLVGTVSGVGVLIALPLLGRHYDRLYRRDPGRAVAMVAWLIIPVGLLTAIQYAMPNPWLWAVWAVPSAVLLSGAFTMVGPVLQSVVPYRIRGLGAALAAVYVFFIGAAGGALLSALVSESAGPRAAIYAVIIPSTTVGGILLLRSAGSIRNDLSLVVAELREELAEAERRATGEPPAIQVHDLDFSYGNVQILFDVSLEVRRGEVLALLGTNGAGKSTLLRVIAGLGTPSRGVVRLDGRTVTYTSPEQRAALGIELLPGGKGTFDELSVQENLEVGGFRLRRDGDELQRRIDEVLTRFPDLESRRRQTAGSLSGGQQQMLALARVLMHRPEVLIIDELSLGLAPAVVQDLLGIVERLRDEGMTIIVVEQSLNVALAIADRAVFMEKGHVRFDGPAAELLERGDLARAVFLGGEEGG